MVAIVRTEWSGTSGGPGLTQFALSGGFNDEWAEGQTQAAVDAVRAFWNALVGLLPNELTLTVMPVVDQYDTITGDLIASFTAGTAPAAVVGTSTGTYAGGVGLKVNWDTGVIRNGRRVKGHTYVVPAVNTAFTATGTAANTAMTTVSTAATNMISSLETATTPLQVWSRPRVVPTPRGGTLAGVASGTCGAKSAILRGRRD